MFEIFESKEKRVVKAHLRHLVRLAKSDGILHGSEIEFIKRVGRKNDINEGDLDKIIQNPTSVDISIPDSREERFDQLFDLVSIMMSDGGVNDAESEFCMELANRLGFRKIIVGVLVSKISRGIEEGLTKEQIKKEAQPFINH